MALYVHILKHAAFGCGDQIVFKKNQRETRVEYQTPTKKKM